MDAAAVTAITSQVDFGTVVTGIGAVAAAVAIVYISIKGAKMLLGMVKGG